MKTVTNFFKAIISTFQEVKQLQTQMRQKYPHVAQ